MIDKKSFSHYNNDVLKSTDKNNNDDISTIYDSFTKIKIRKTSAIVDIINV